MSSSPNRTSLHVADDDGGVVGGGHSIHLLRAGGSSQIEDIGSGFEAGFCHSGLIGLDGDQNIPLAKTFEDGQELALLTGVVQARGVGERGFRAEIDDVRTLSGKGLAATNRRFDREADALAIPGIRREIDDAHDRRF